MDRIGSHAAVVGGSMAGLLSARVLSEAYDRVTVVERDDLGEPGPRRGVPQGRHLHALLPRGNRILDDLFPGLTEELAAAGAPCGSPSDARLWFADAPLVVPDGTDLRVVDVSRPTLERHVRDRVLRLPNVAVRTGTASGLLADASGDRVTGLALDGDEVVAADLVVDASGRSSQLPAWLEAGGWAAPAETRMRVDVAYASCRYRLPHDAFGGAQEVVVAGTPEQPRTAAMQRLEDGDWLVTLAGYLGDHPPTDHDGWLGFLAGVRVPEVHETIAAGERLGDIVRHRFPHYQRRHYERLRRAPEGLLVVGDAVCSFNPVYGQGMSIAALEADALRRLLGGGAAGLGRRHRRAVGKLVDVAWELSTSGDLRFPGVEGRRTPKVRLLNRYVAAVQAAGAVDPQVGIAFLRVITLIEPPPSLLHPRVVRRVLAARRRPAPAAPAPDRLATGS